MTNYASIDPEIQRWAKRHLLAVGTSSAGRESRFVYVSSIAGECFQIWVESPTEGQVALHAACIEGRKDSEPPTNWLVAATELEKSLENAFETVLQWMRPSTRHFA
jgi:hypothetical protein